MRDSFLKLLVCSTALALVAGSAEGSKTSHEARLAQLRASKATGKLAQIDETLNKLKDKVGKTTEENEAIEAQKKRLEENRLLIQNRIKAEEEAIAKMKRSESQSSSSSSSSAAERKLTGVPTGDGKYEENRLTAVMSEFACKAGAAMHMYFDTDRKKEHLIEYNKQAEQLEVTLKSLKLTETKWEPGRERVLAAYVIWHTFHIVHKSKEFSKIVDFHDSKERKEADRLTKSIKETAMSVGAWPIEVEKDCAELLRGPKTATGAQQGRIESIIAELEKIDEGNAKNMRAAYKI